MANARFNTGAIFEGGITAYGGVSGGIANGDIYYVDGTNGTTTGDGLTWATALSTIQAAVDKLGVNGTIYVAPKEMAAAATDPGSYSESVIIGADNAGTAIIGVSRGRTQGGLPQMKVGTTTTNPILTIRAPGCLIANMGINGAGATGGGILLDDDSSTKTAIGTTIENCHFKNCKATGAAATGGAIYWNTTGGAWQVLIKDSHFYNCRAGIVLRGTSVSRPQDVVIDGCTFMSSANTTIDADIYLAGGSGVNGLIIRDCDFATVDVPAYATSPTAARYMDLTNCTNGIVSHCTFACLVNPAATEVTFGAAGTAAKIPTTVRIAGCTGESSSTTEQDIVYRT